MVRDSPRHYGWRTVSDGDGVSIFDGSHIWVDHCSLSNCNDNQQDNDNSHKASSAATAASDVAEELLELSRSFSDFSSSSASDISGELRRLASLAPFGAIGEGDSEKVPDSEIEPCLGLLHRESFSAEIIESISPEDLQPTVKLCVDALGSLSTAIQRSAAAKLRLLAKNRSDNRLLIVESGAVPALIPLLKSPDPLTQEHAVTALLNLSLHEDNKSSITKEGAIKPLVYALATNQTQSVPSLMYLEVGEEQFSQCE